MKRFGAWLLCLLLCLTAVTAQAAQGLPLQACHRVELEQVSKNQQNGAKVVRWTIKTVLPSVDAALNGLAEDYVADLAGSLKRPGGSSNQNSTLTVSIRPSRTGLTWMSFMVQARTVYHQQTEDVCFTTRTYDMTTGEAVRLTDIFEDDPALWEMLGAIITERVEAYYPDIAAPADKVAALTAPEAIKEMDFTLHGMSLVLHLDAQTFYPGHPQLIEVPLYYPDITPYMTEKARVETDNTAYYYTAALTFDDGPNGWITDRILQTLMAHGERATFFLVGERIKQQAFHVQREHDEGHAVATHNWQHVYANSTPASQLAVMGPKVDQAHIAAIGIAPSYARAPGGQWRGIADANLGWPLIQWTVEAQDWDGDKGPDPNRTARNIVGGTTDGGIILMHDLKQNSIEATDMILDRLQEKGFILLTVDELFAKDGVELMPNTPYWCCVNGETNK